MSIGSVTTSSPVTPSPGDATASTKKPASAAQATTSGIPVGPDGNSVTLGTLKIHFGTEPGQSGKVLDFSIGSNHTTTDGSKSHQYYSDGKQQLGSNYFNINGNFTYSYHDGVKITVLTSNDVNGAKQTGVGTTNAGGPNAAPTGVIVSDGKSAVLLDGNGNSTPVSLQYAQEEEGTVLAPTQNGGYWAPIGTQSPLVAPPADPKLAALWKQATDLNLTGPGLDTPAQTAPQQLTGVNGGVLTGSSEIATPATPDYTQATSNVPPAQVQGKDLTAPGANLIANTGGPGAAQATSVTVNPLASQATNLDLTKTAVNTPATFIPAQVEQTGIQVGVNV